MTASHPAADTDPAATAPGDPVVAAALAHLPAAATAPLEEQASVYVAAHKALQDALDADLG